MLNECHTGPNKMAIKPILDFIEIYCGQERPCAGAINSSILVIHVTPRFVALNSGMCVQLFWGNEWRAATEAAGVANTIWWPKY